MHVQSLFQCNISQKFSLVCLALLCRKGEITRSFFHPRAKASEPTCTFFHVVLDRIIKWGMTLLEMSLQSRFGPEYADRYLMGLISSEEFQKLVAIRLLWSNGGQNINDEHRAVIRGIYSQGIPEIMLCKVLRQTSRNFKGMFERHGGSLESGAVADAGEDDVVMPEGFGDASAARGHTGWGGFG
jgi:hypothetical protein